MDAEEYRRRAQHHLALARQMTNATHRAALLDLAGIWMRLAQQAELNERILQQQDQMLAETEGAEPTSALPSSNSRR
jgi:hypothetical protein